MITFFCLKLTNEIQEECVKCVQTVETFQKKLKLKSFLERILSPAFPGTCTLVYHTSHKHVHVGACTLSRLLYTIVEHDLVKVRTDILLLSLPEKVIEAMERTCT